MVSLSNHVAISLRLNTRRQITIATATRLPRCARNDKTGKTERPWGRRIPAFRADIRVGKEYDRRCCKEPVYPGRAVGAAHCWAGSCGMRGIPGHYRQLRRRFRFCYAAIVRSDANQRREGWRPLTRGRWWLFSFSSSNSVRRPLSVAIADCHSDSAVSMAFSASTAAVSWGFSFFFQFQQQLIDLVQLVFG